ncbi:hypothetical protein L1987_87917 [Smallanthus sonchifolius]|nr:hypothetical protein L1987_87917 [Smallanthus sonchifolius]
MLHDVGRLHATGFVTRQHVARCGAFTEHEAFLLGNIDGDTKPCLFIIQPPTFCSFQHRHGQTLGATWGCGALGSRNSRVRGAVFGVSVRETKSLGAVWLVIGAEGAWFLGNLLVAGRS